MSNFYFFILLALAAGVAAPLQGAVNHRLAESVNSTILSAFVSFFVGAAVLFIYIVLSGTPLGNLAQGRNAPAMAWTGGLFGAFFVAATIMLIPRIGVAMTFGVVVAGQVLMTLVIDHFGMFDTDVRPISIAKIAGIVLITAGVVLIRKF